MAKARPVGTGASGIKTTDWAFNADDRAVLRALATGEHDQDLREYFGSAAYAELSTLAARAALCRATRPKSREATAPQKVLIIPGIMGSKLGRAKSAGTGSKVIWISPLRIARGQLMQLALPRGAAIRPLGVMLFTYAKLKFMLDIAGFDARFHAYDWRLSIHDLGRQLATRISGESEPVMLVAHSMGGLVARAALTGLPKSCVRRLIVIGTPHGGSYAAVQALCGTYPTVRKIAMLDMKHSAEELAKRLFRGFAGLYDLLPVRDPKALVDIYRVKAWPKSSSNVDPALLASALVSRNALAPVDSRFRQIIGVDQATAAGIRKQGKGFAYDLTSAGDGTVAVTSAHLPGAPAYYLPEIHGSLPNNSQVILCVIDLLRRGVSRRLPRLWRPRRNKASTVTDAELRSQFRDKVDWRTLNSEERERLSAHFNTSVRAVAQNAYRPKIAISAAFGSIADSTSKAIVLGLYRNVAPGGAATAVDQRLNGAVSEFTARRMFSADVGQIFMLPAKIKSLRALTVVFAGMGDFDRFDADTQQFVSENIVRTFARTGITEVSTVLLGTGSGISVADAVDNQLRGYLRAIQAAGPGFKLKRITFCAVRRGQYDELRAALRVLRGAQMFTAFDPSFREEKYRPPAGVRPRIAPAVTVGAVVGAAALPGISYLIVSQDRGTATGRIVRTALLTAGAKAAVFSSVREIPHRAYEALLDDLHGGDFSEPSLKTYGERLGRLMLDADLRAALAQSRANHLAIVHDAAMSQVPWEALRIGQWTPASAAGLSRRYAAENLSLARWSESRRLGNTLDVLLVANPTQDLPGADAEARRLIEVLADRDDVRLNVVQGAQATRARVLSDFRSGAFDVLHYAGHAHFSPDDPGRSGIICAGGEVLTGADLAGLNSLPSLVFFNACESGRLRAANQRKIARRSLAKTDGLAECFLRGGVANYLGTYWPVGDAAAMAFSTALYSSLVAGAPLGTAVNKGRAAVRVTRSCDWADYLHYGSYDFVIKAPSPLAARPGRALGGLRPGRIPD